MDACLVYAPELAHYDLGPSHPLRPERFTLAVELMEAYGLLPADTAGTGAAVAPEVPVAPALDVVHPDPATDEDLLLVHDADYIATVKEASGHPNRFLFPRAGLGPGDTPAFAGVHEASALVAGGAVRAADGILDGTHLRALNVAGGLHHAHRDRAAGFCVYNDPAIGIAHALRREPGLRILYIDIDAHHGDGVQEAFYSDGRVLTFSIHETGMALYPGTGFTWERGEGAGLGCSMNVSMPPMANDACYRHAFLEALAPAAARFSPDLIAAQCGADAHHSDPLTTLGLTVPGHGWLTRSIVSLANEVCGGRLMTFGGGGYSWEHVVPRCWTLLASAIAGRELPEDLPEAWRTRAREVAGVEPPRLLSEDPFSLGERAAGLLATTKETVAGLMEGPLPPPREASAG